MTYSPKDPSLNHVISDSAAIHNNAGLLGAYISGTLSDIFGIAAYIWPLVFGAVGVACIGTFYELLWWRWLGYFLLTLCLLFIGAAWDLHIGEIYGGGMIGNTLYMHASRLLSHWGSVILWFFLFTMAIQLTFGISWLACYYTCKKAFVARISAMGPLALPQWSGPSLSGMSDSLKKLTASSPQEALPEAHDIEAIEVDDPAIRIVRPDTSTTQKTQKKANAAQQHEPPHPEEDVIYDAPYSETDETEHSATQEAAPITPTPEIPKKKKSRSFFSFGKKDTPPAEEHSSPHASSSVDETQQAPASTPSNAMPELAPFEYDEQPSPVEHDEQPSAVEYDDYREDDEQETTQSAVSAPIQEQPSPVPVAQPSVSPSTPTPTAPIRMQEKKEYVFPSLEFLQRAIPSSPAAEEEMRQKGDALVCCLADFGVQGKLVRITPGPVVTMYEFRPAAGIRVNRIANLTDDIALALKAIAIRIQAPIPGSDTVGIEIPNVQRDIVNFREILESKTFTDAGGPLNIVLGKDIAGKPFVSELSKMPHLLVAGATGAGKSVGLNTILMSLLYTTQPSDMQLLLIDPKRIEMAVYAELPHLVHPVVTEMQFAKTALEWAVAEMDARYAAMERLGVRNITGYNQKIKDFGDTPPADLADLQVLPYLVIIIDELADLMLTAAREVETSIVRLAQLARAAGIHMILATQRPSVDVVTGIIKANFPCRISFQVTSKHDSRTILDMVGAEHLLGKGDMLFKPSGGRLMRLHGPFVPDEEVQAVVDHWKRQSPPQYKVDFSQWGTEQNEVSSGGLGDASGDSLYPDVRAFVEEQGKASISLVQRRFRIGFNRAAVLMEQLERDGIIGPAEGSKPRSVIKQ